MKNLVRAFFFGCLISALVSCSNPSGSDDTISIEVVGWSVNNYDLNYWEVAPRTDGATMFISFYVQYSENIAPEDIASIRIEDPDGRYWEKDSAEMDIDEVNRTIEMNNCFTSAHLTKTRLGEWTATVTLANGNSDVAAVTITEPDSTAIPTKEYATSGFPLATEVAALSQVTGTTLEESGGTITVTFDVNEDRSKNGYIWFFDSSNNYLGSSGYFINSSGADHPNLVSTYNVAGANVFNLSAATVTNTTIASDQFVNIAKCVVIIIDGDQYPSSTTAYDYRSIGPRVSLP